MDGMLAEARDRRYATTDDIPYTRGQAQHCMPGMHSVQCPDFGAHRQGHQACGLAIRGNAQNTRGETQNFRMQVHSWVKFILIQIRCYVR